MARKLDGIGKLSFAIVLALFIVGILALQRAFGADKYQVFPLNQPIVERAVICIEEAAAVEGAKLAAADKQAELAKWAERVDGKLCASIAAEIIYRKRVFFQDVDGVPFTVYQAEIQGVTVYVPMQGYRHDHPV